MTREGEPPRMPLDQALAQASDENGLAEHYRDCVRPILRDRRYPRCCGGGCEPCATLLERVAERTFELMGEAPPRREGEP